MDLALGSLLCRKFFALYLFAELTMCPQVIAVSVIILVQGWSSIFPTFSAVDFVSFYIELPVMLVMSSGWLIARKLYQTPQALKRSPSEQHLGASTHPNYRSISHSPPAVDILPPPTSSEQPGSLNILKRLRNVTDIVDTRTVDLHVDEYHEDTDDQLDDETREKRLSGKWRLLWRLYYLLA